jgi:hypothetical protein
LRNAAHAYRSIPKGTAKLQRLEQYRFGLFKGEAVSQAKADAHGSEARDWDLHVAEFLSVDHVFGGDRCRSAVDSNLEKDVGVSVLWETKLGASPFYVTL